MENQPNEEQYKQLIRSVLASKTIRPGRGGATTRSTFGVTSRYSLDNNTIPLLTTKKMFTRGIIEELLWMLRGSTNVKELQERNVHIWDAHSSREHLDKNPNTKHLEEGDIGPGYGHQWRHAGAPYKSCTTDYTGIGVDQINDVINSLRNDPASRRHIVCSWNPVEVNNMALPPCHCLFQFYLDDRGLSCQMYQRSADVALGVPFNIAFYSILTHLIAKMIGTNAHELIHVIGDAHIYSDHEDPLIRQLEREPLGFPTLEINNVPSDPSGFKSMMVSDFVVKNYKSHPTIKMNLVA